MAEVVRGEFDIGATGHDLADALLGSQYKGIISLLDRELSTLYPELLCTYCRPVGLRKRIKLYAMCWECTRRCLIQFKNDNEGVKQNETTTNPTG